MNVYVKTGSAGLILVICVAVISYSPLFGTFYEDWKKGRELDRLEALLEENSEVRKFTIDGGAVFASSLNIQLKAVSESLVGAKIEVSPVYPVLAPGSEGYTFTIKLEDEDGFKIREIVVIEREMQPVIGKNPNIQLKRTYETSLTIPIKIYERVRRVEVSYSALPRRKAEYDELRTKTGKQILDGGIAGAESYEKGQAESAKRTITATEFIEFLNEPDPYKAREKLLDSLR
ncbi:hypothetical protein OAH36_02570 [Verrucomicrobia bacterium]|nr:hypothetical protein [Verrucomicrobiota bacterium]